MDVGSLLMTSDHAGEPEDPTVASMSVPSARTTDAQLRRLYESHGPALLSYLVRFTRGDREWAEDILQETLMRAWRHPEAQTLHGEWITFCALIVPA